MKKELKPNYYKIMMVVLLLAIGVLFILRFTREETPAATPPVKPAVVEQPTVIIQPSEERSVKEKSSEETKICTLEEPYEISEEYQSKEPYGPKHCAQKPINFTAAPLPREIRENNTITCRLNVTNIDEIDGAWYFGAYYNQPGGRKQLADVKKAIPAGESVIYNWNFKVSYVGRDDNCVMYAAGSPTALKCFYAEPITYKVVNKIRTITKYKNVTKAC